jgi:hypothetical protein
MWWLIEAKDETAQDDSSEIIWTRDWESRAGSLVDAINSMHWVFEFVIHGEIRAPRHEWLCCDACDESQGAPKAYGAPSQKRKCHMTHGCTGTLRRLPDIWAITHPKPRPKPKAPQVAQTPGAARVRKKLHLDEESVDISAA